MAIEYLGLSAVGWQLMISTWWDQLLAAFLLTTIVLGLAYLGFTIARYVIRRRRERRTKSSVPRHVTRYLKSLRRASRGPSNRSSIIEKTPKEELSSFGVFLGSFACPPTAAQQRILTQWDVLVVDPFQAGVNDALAGRSSTSRHILGRLDVSALAGSTSSTRAEDVVRALGAVNQALESHFLPQKAITGILLAGYRSHLEPAVVGELARYVRERGLDLWLELAYPEYLTEDEARDTEMRLVRGIIYRNGTIRPDGDRQNYFQMAEMRAVMRAVAAQRVAHGPALVMWETVDDDVEMQYAVVTRTYNWCTYNSALCWIGFASALTDSEVIDTRSIAAKPLGALMWLKDEANMAAHDVWRGNDQVSAGSVAGRAALYESLASFVPDLASRLQLRPGTASGASSQHHGHSASIVSSQSATSLVHGYSYSGVNPLSASVKGDDFTGLGCFQLGHEASFSEFAEIRKSQCHLKDLDLLVRLKGDEIAKVRQQVAAVQGSRDLSLAASHAINDLLDLLKTVDEPENPRLKVYSGLHSGFQGASGAQYWGLYDFDPVSDCMVLYLSNKAKDRAATILHTYLSSRQCTRIECFIAEQAMAEKNGRLVEPWLLAPRILQDLEQLSPIEAITLLRRLQSLKNTSAFLKALRACAEYQLLDVPALTQQRALASSGYLGGTVSAEELVASRLAWLADKGCLVPDRNEAIELFREVDDRLYAVLMGGENDVLTRIGEATRSLCQPGAIDAAVDILALAIFSAFRRLALDEVYLEVLDRNVYPNHAADQAGCFAENFALGSRCDSFFDTTPRSVGRLISDRYRAYYMKHQPPRRVDGFTELPTAYAAMQVDLDPEDGKEKVSFRYQFTFFGIFAVPALVDVILLTTIGRGLYLTTYMSSEQKTMATTALMLALLMSGSFGAWLCTGGSYYFYANAFPAMNMFILTRFAAGFAVTLVISVIGFIIIICVQNTTSALIFLFYFFMLSTYLLVLNALSIYQLPGSSFLSGRTAIITCIPILLISPIVTIFTQHDITVYVPVLSAFLISLCLQARKVVSRWGSWYLDIPSVKDAEIIDWYRKSQGSAADLVGMADNDIMPLARAAIHAAVLKEAGKWWFTRATTDALVSKLAVGYQSTLFLMRWYCRHKRSRMPMPYSTTWNLTLKAGIENMTNMQKGLKLHSAFLHWRSTGRDIWSGLLYFIVALLDKWVALLTGGGLVGLSAASSTEFRLGVGFGLCYYLVGAVSLDTVSQPLWTAANERTNQPITSLEFLREATGNDARARRHLYWRSLCKFFFLHTWGASVFAALMWVFQDSRDNTIMFLAYVGAYSGLLWWQYNKIFCGTQSARSLAIAAILGLPAGLALHIKLPDFAYSGVISLAFTTWTACICSFWTIGLGWPTIFQRRGRSGSGYTRANKDEDEKSLLSVSTFSVSTLEPHPPLSQATLSKMFQSARNLPAEKRYTLDPSRHPGERVIELLSFSGPYAPARLNEAFPSAEDVVELARLRWKSGKVVVELVSSRDLPCADTDASIRAISCCTGENLHIFVLLGPDRADDEWALNVPRHWKVISEAIVQATAEHQLGLSHDDATLAELLVVDHADEASGIRVPEGIKRQIETSPLDRVRIIREGDKTTLRYLLLGVDCETEWDLLPKPVRAYLLKRTQGSSSTPASSDVWDWVRSRITSRDVGDVETYIARCNLGAALSLATVRYAKDYESDGSESDNEGADDGHVLSEANQSLLDGKLKAIVPVSSTLVQKVKLCIKFFILSLTADPEYQRELDYVIADKPAVLRWPIVFFLNGIWSYCKLLQSSLVPVVLFHGHERLSEIRKHMRGMTTVLEKNRIVTESFSGPSTWFWASQTDGTLRLSQYGGLHDREPSDPKQLVAVNTYTDKLVLKQRELYRKGAVANSFRYEYKNETSKLPLQRQCTSGELEGEIVSYDRRGYITSGSAMRGVNRVDWKFWYRKSAKHEDELLWAEYTFPHITIKVLWSMPPRNPQKRLDHWIPFSTVTEATFIQGEEVYHASWDYEHKFHPEVSVTLNGQPVVTPPMIREDWFHVLQKPEKCSFLSESPLLSFSSVRTNPISRLLRLNVKRYPIPTSVARTQLWKAWKGGRDVDAISARWLDEKALRSDRIMRRYWRLRDFGCHSAARQYLDTQADTIMAQVDVDPQISSWVHIAYKFSDLYSCGQGGDSVINTRKLSSQLRDSESELHVLAMDTSTWPNDPGGVSACRRDMVNDLHTIKWHVLAESANDYGVPRFQIERNVQSLTILPLWGLDFLNPTHGVLETSLDSAVVQRSYNTQTADIEQNFLPILTSLVRCARTNNLRREHLDEATRALVDLNTYFESSRNWNDVWGNPVVQQRWRELWLAEDMDDVLNISQWWDFEKPTLKQLDEALNLWCRYLFIFSLPVPEEIPDVFQASHHFTGATYGIVCKAKRNCALHIWDHCISLREFTTFMSSAVSYDMPFVNSSLISLTHLSCTLLEHHADVVLPCCDYFNPGWEVELGTAEGAVEHRRTFARKIDPVVNGICNMEKFEPIKTIKTSTPTVVMLSHIQYVKDIKNAIMATDIIVNKWGFKDYQLHVYGDQERAATIATECQELIASKNLQDHCILKGLGNASLVLQDAWLFLNSSISEGLPLAMGEAALTGVPVVCTDVGASYCVVTDARTGDRFSEVVPPNDSESLARAQISVMGLLGRWSAYAGDAEGEEVPELAYPTPAPEQVQQIAARMYAKQEQRRALGMLGRQNVLNNFSSERYLREHEQMLWIGKHRSPAHRARTAAARVRDSAASGSLPGSVRSSVWLGGRGKSAYSSLPSRPVSRLTPESWVSLASEETLARGKLGWRSLSSSTLSVRDIFREKHGKSQLVNVEVASTDPPEPISIAV